MNKYLITGGAGFIGSNIAEHLVRQGHFVRVLDNFSFGNEENLSFAQEFGPKYFELIRGDITSAQDCERSCRGMDYVLHHAALRSVPESLQQPHQYNHVNINGLLCMLQAASRAHIKRFVFASSAAVYGNSPHEVLREQDFPLAMSPYALTKLAGEYYCRVFSEHFSLETVCLRYFNVFGPKQALDDEYAVVIPKFIHCVLNDQAPPVFGNGLQSRDFVYISNLVPANVLAATTPGLKHEIFNVACGRETTLLELVKALGSITGKNVVPEFLPDRPGDIFRTKADVDRITQMLHYKPVADLKVGLERTVAYFREQRRSACAEKKQLSTI